MDELAIKTIRNYVLKHLTKTETEPEFEVYIVWKCKTLQNWKYLISTSIEDDMYYELTYNGDKEVFYLDAYKKVHNETILANWRNV